LKSGGGQMTPDQKESVLNYVKEQKAIGRKVSEILQELGVARSNYYRWCQQRHQEEGLRREVVKINQLTPHEIQAIERIKEQNPGYRHRRIQGELLKNGYYISYTRIYEHLKELGLIEAFFRRPSPLKEPRYEVIGRNQMWGLDWTKLLVDGIRWYLISLIDFFSRLWIAFQIVPTVHAGIVKALYWEGILSQKLRNETKKPALRADRGSPNTAWTTREFFETLGADLSWARVRRPTDNALTERHFGTIKQEEIYLVGNYPDQKTATRELKNYQYHYNHERPHQALWNFTPAEIHEVNNKTKILNKLKEIKKASRKRRRDYWLKQQNSELLFS